MLYIDDDEGATCDMLLVLSCDGFLMARNEKMKTSVMCAVLPCADENGRMGRKPT